MARPDDTVGKPDSQTDTGEALAAIRERHRGHSVEERAAPPQPGSAWRGISLGILGVVILSFVTPYADAYMESSGLSATYLPTGVVLLFLLMLGINTLLRLTRFPLSQRELMLAYVTMLVPSAMPADGWSLRLVPLLVELDYYATPVNEWRILHGSNVPHWMTPHGNEVVTWFFTGKPAGAKIPWEPWVRPLAIWCVLAAGLYLIMLSLSIAFRKRWMDAERLQFPLAQVPLMIMGDDPAPSWRSKFFRQPLLWAGMAVPFIFHTMNGLHLYFPAIPGIQLNDISFRTMFAGSRFITEPPFDQWGGVLLNFYWSVIGISYLLRSEVSLSVWAFEWFYNFEKVIFQWSGYGNGQFEWSPLHTFGYSLMARYQRAGAIAAATIVFFIASRKEIGELVRAAFGMRSVRTRESEAAMPWWSLWAFVAGITIYFTWTAATGMKTIAAAVLLAFFVGIAITTARIVAASGLLWVYDFFVPMHGLTVLVGTARIDPRSFTNVGYVDFVALNNRASIMPQILDGMKITRLSGIRQKHFFIGIILGTIIGTFVSMVTVLWLGYTYGGANMTDFMFRGGGEWLFNRVAGFQQYRVYTHWTVVGCMGAGAAFMLSLLHLHRTYLWWPIYPLGFLFGDTVASNQIWFPVMLGWLGKTLIVRFAGAGTYDRFKSAALGLVLGEFLCVGIWMAIDAATGLTLHRVFPVWFPK